MKPLAALYLLVLCSVPLSAQSVFPVQPGNGEAPDRTYDVLHYRIEVSFDEPKKMVYGTVTTTLVPFLPSFTSLDVDAEEMQISSVLLGGKAPLTYTMGKSKLTINLDKRYSLRDTLSVSISYSCSPRKGLYFVQPDSGYPDKPAQIWSQGEDMNNHFWFPCYDFPNDRATSEVIATVQSRYTALSNGRLISVAEDTKKGTKTFHWRQSKPHVSYLIMLAIGEYTVLRDKVKSLPLEYYVYPRQVEDAKVCFSQTPNMIRFFNEKIGFTYPWEKYAQVLIRDFVVGGMENTSATSLADDATVFDARARLDHSPVSLIAHELAHQWWGDVVTCEDWRHIWLNESFASYFDPLYHEYSLGRDEFSTIMYTAQLAGINSDKTQGRKPIVSVGSYGTNVYPRGASVLHMLRFILGDELFWRAMKHYIIKHQFTTVETKDFQEAIEEATGMNLYWFFDQWVYKAGYPTFSVSYVWVDSLQLVHMTVKQTQIMDSLTGVFMTPVDIEVMSPAGKTGLHAFLTTADTVLTIPSREKPTLVIFDKGNWLLKELKFSKDRSEWKLQAETADDPVDRIRAINEMAMMEHNEEFASTIARASVHDRFWAVRREAINSLPLVTDSSARVRETIKMALVEASHDPKATVRAAAMAQIRDFRGTDVTSRVHEALRDPSYSVIAAALRALPRVDSANAVPILRRYLDSTSYQNVVASAALRALQDADSTVALREAIARLRYGVPSPVRMTALGTVTRSIQHGTTPPQLLLPLLSDKSVHMRDAVARTLGNVGKEDVIPALEAIASDSENPSAAIAKRSIARIRERSKH